MRIVSVVLPVIMALLALTGCVSRVGPAAAPAVSPLPSRSTVTGECDASDIEVTGDLDEKPVVTVPTDCSPPTTLLAKDLTVGDGEQAVRGSDLEVAYVMIAWTGGVVLDTTWSGDSSWPLSVTNLGDSGWRQGLLGMREGGRRLFVVPPDPDLNETGTGDTIVYVVDAMAVS
jgi:peptidylprolyl isomerase